MVGSFLTFTLASGLQIIHVREIKISFYVFFQYLKNIIIYLQNTQISEWVHQGCIVFIVYLRIFICAESVENMTSAVSFTQLSIVML